MKKVAIILSGCGNRDGSELQETISLMLAMDRKGIAYQAYAPTGDLRVVSYLNGQETGERRDILAEAGRLTRGNTMDLAQLRVEDYDALAMPGGMGAARNLSTYAFDGEKMTVHPLVERALRAAHKAGKPIMGMCIAPIVIARVLGDHGVSITLGGVNDASRAAQSFGAAAVVCGPTDVCRDPANRVVTTPAYMAASHISEIFDGARNMVDAFLEMTA